ncbi:hypothetical protein MYK68_14995 [Gordonia sp. PP30]|uniref:hypothetical protein n=1 Tax=Gordonia sp. PP30 TaxID=2935861 RepID=UPI001FFE5233|nr:hypothetical protein [Gordonia sp. PP30]UQE74033.1 hypothetical protein MYK68_14995 [Gordonia sp. PP30]
MNKNINIATIALAAVTVTLAGCTSTEPVSAPSSSTAPTVTVPELRLATGMDRVAAEAAIRAGRPYLVGLPDGASVACHAALLVPGDPSPWILNRDAVPASGAAFETDYAQYGCSGRSVPDPNASAPTAPLDTTATEAARSEGRPFIYAMPNGLNPVCNVGVRLADGTEWFLNRSTGPSAKGDALSLVQRGYGCTNGETVPGVPAN